MSQNPPLTSNINWRFEQASVGIRAPIIIISNETGKIKKKVISVQNICREGLIHTIRRKLQDVMVRSLAGSSWQQKSEIHSHVDLDAERLKQPGESFLTVCTGHITRGYAVPHPKAGQKDARRNSYWPALDLERYPAYQYRSRPMSPDKVRDFLNFCDAIIGPITVLLNPDRYTGNWWKTSYEEATANKNPLRWYGIDNTALIHPALTSLYTGLARQCALLVRTGLRKEILADSDPVALRKCLTKSDPEIALKLVQKMETWIAVPRPADGNIHNVPVPRGDLPKIIMLHESIYKHGFEKTFGRTVERSWGLLTGPYGENIGPAERRYSGIHTFMGRGSSGAESKRIYKLAKQKSA